MRLARGFWLWGIVVTAGCTGCGGGGGGSAPRVTRYVSTAGLDTNSGMQEAPLRTLQRAAELAGPGDTVVISDGEYAGGLQITRGGTSGAPVAYRAAHPGSVTIRGDQTSAKDGVLVTNADWVVLEGLTVKYAGRGIRVDLSNHVTIRNCHCLDNRLQGIFTDYSDDLLIENNECSRSAEQHGIYCSNGGDRPIVRNNVCSDNASAGIQINGSPEAVRKDLGTRGDGIIEGAVVSGNIISHCGLLATSRGAAINLGVVRGSLISCNLIYNCLGSGIALSGDPAPAGGPTESATNVYAQNTVYFRPGEGRWCMSIKHVTMPNVVLNNILVGGLHGSLEFDNRTKLTSNGNVLFSSEGKGVAFNADIPKYYSLSAWSAVSGQDVHSLEVDLGLITPSATSDFRPPNHSPALGTGVLQVTVPADLDGRPFGLSGRWDAGCYAGPSGS